MTGTEEVERGRRSIFFFVKSELYSARRSNEVSYRR